jgi:crossover junction endodeoxyribonuclease RuvC
MSSAGWWRRYYLKYREKNNLTKVPPISTSETEVRILGIDPGTVTGYGIIEICQSQPQGNNCIYITSGNIVNYYRKPPHIILKDLYDGIVNIIKKYSPHEVVVENVFFAKSAKTALNLGQVRGIALLAAASEGLNVYEYSALEVKKAITGYGRAEKRQVQEMVKRILNLKSNPGSPDSEASSRGLGSLLNITEDASDALALAICHMNTLKLREAINKS